MPKHLVDIVNDYCLRELGVSPDLTKPERFTNSMIRLKTLVEHARNRRRRRRLERRLKSFDEESRTTLLDVQPYTMLSANKLFVLIEAARYVHRCAIPGAVVECGVWRGGAMMAAATTFRHLGVADRDFYLYDTFAGMTKPTDKDNLIFGSTDPREKFEQTRTGADSSDWCRAGVEEVKQNLAETAYDSRRFVTVQGKVEDTIPDTLPDEIAILHLDTDWYESTRHEMVHLFPRLVPKGVLIIDDYHYWSGVRDAVDEYLTESKIPIFLMKVDNCVAGVRP